MNLKKLLSKGHLVPIYEAREDTIFLIGYRRKASSRKSHQRPFLLLIDHYIKKAMGEDETILLADGLESAFMGIGRQFTHPVAIYSYKKVIKILMRDHKMDRENAEEYFDFNIAGAFVGDQTPVFLQDE
jgi:hypothetical protein